MMQSTKRVRVWAARMHSGPEVGFCVYFKDKGLAKGFIYRTNPFLRHGYRLARCITHANWAKAGY